MIFTSNMLLFSQTSQSHNLTAKYYLYFCAFNQANHAEYSEYRDHRTR